MKEQQEKIRVLDPHIILILFISAFVFGIGILMIFLERKEIRTEGYEFIIFSVEILMLLLILVLYENCCSEQRRLYGILAVLEEKL